MRLALLSDIHGNSWALDAVLADARLRSVDALYDLGDTVYGPLDPKGTAERLIAEAIPGICGNQDRDVYAPADPAGLSSLEFTLSCLSGEQMEWLRRLPATREVEGVLLCHGTPASDTTYLLESVHRHGAALAAEEEIRSRLGGVSHRVIACGHSHVPRTVQLSGDILAVNPGSVGLPAYTDSLPYPHAMEAGSPHARYAILTRRSQGWTVEHIAAPYDWEKAARAAAEHGRLQWAQWIRSGRASASIEY